MSNEIERDVTKGLKFLTKSCEMNNATACFYLSGMHISGIVKEDQKTTTKEPSSEQFVIPKNMTKAFEYAEKSCQLNNMYACANLSQMYSRGDGVTKDEKKAELYKKKAQEMQEELRKQQATLKFQQGA